MRTKFYGAALAPLLLFIGLPAQAATWEIDNEASSVTFHYSYDGTPYQGEFRNIDATFEIDPMNPGSCQFDVTIPIEDLYVDDAETMDYLLGDDLFNVSRWPTAEFQAENCRVESMDSFVADGTLRIRDETNEISFPFELDVDDSGDQVRFHLTSEVTIQRLEYGVGQGYLANTSSIPNDVDVVVDVYAVRQ